MYVFVFCFVFSKPVYLLMYIMVSRIEAGILTEFKMIES